MLVRNMGVLVLILLVGVGFAAIAYYVAMNLEGIGPGILLTLKLYDFDAEGGRFVDVTPTILNDPDVLMYIEVDAVVLPSFKWGDDKVTIIKTTAKPKETIFVESSELLEISKEWIHVYGLRSGNPEETYSGLIIRLFIYNGTSGDVLFEAYDSVSYKPIEITRGKSLRVMMSLVRGSPQPIELNGYHDVVTRYEASRAGIEEIVESSRCGIWWIERDPVVIIGPNRLTTQLPSDYFNNVDGVLYVKTPVLIVKNSYSYSGVVAAFILIGTRSGSIGVYPTLAMGQILDPIASGITPSLTLRKGSGFTWGGSSYDYGRTLVVNPLQDRWAWIWARPIFTIYEVYRATCTSSGSEKIRVYLHDEAEHLITNILTSGIEIVGGSSDGLPHNNLMQMFFNGTNLIRLQIPDTWTANGDLDPGESTTFRRIFRYFDTCGADFKVGIPVGVMAALGICSALGYSPGAPACAAAIAFASAFQISLSIQGSSISINGGIENLGEENGVGYDVTEYVYMAISRYQYGDAIGTCSYNVPAGIYLDFR